MLRLCNALAGLRQGHGKALAGPGSAPAPVGQPQATTSTAVLGMLGADASACTLVSALQVGAAVVSLI